MIFQEIRPIMFLLWPMPRRLRDETSNSIQFSVRGGYHSVDKDVDFASATALRQHQKEKDFLERFMPSVALFEQASKVSWDDYFAMLRYQILSNPDLTTIYQVNREMAVRIKEAIKTAQSVEELVEAVATKRYTKARVRRLLTYNLGAGQRK